MLTVKAVGVGKIAASAALTVTDTGKTRLIPIIIATRCFLTASFIVRFINILTHQARLHFLMTRIDYRLVLALALSLILHLAPLLNPITTPAPPPPKATPLEAQLRPQPAPVQAPLMMPEQPAPQPSPPPKKITKPQITQQGPAPTRVSNWQDEVKRQIKKLDERGLFYPAEAIAQGLDGEALVLLIINENGEVSAARIEQGSGHRILDDAALRAVRSLRSLPANAPRETLLPVRFRLK
jgi:protein TonB